MDRDETARELEVRIASREMIAVVLKDSGKLIGNLYLGKRDFGALELGYVFNKHYWHQGYAKESCQAVIGQAFSAGVHRIYAECDPCNSPSWKLLERLGFVREGYFKQNVYFWTAAQGYPIWKDTFVYSLLRNAQNLPIR